MQATRNADSPDASAAADGKAVSIGTLKFEAASVKPSPDSQTVSRSGLGNPGRLRLTGYSPVRLLATAYGIRENRIIAPEWTLRERFDIEATMPPETTLSQRGEMLRQLLADRFSVRARREMRSMSALALVRVRDDGRLGPQLRQVERDCTQVVRDDPSLCQSREAPGVRISRGSPWQQIYLADFLERYLRTVVVDRTGLSGQFDLALEWREGLIPADGPDQINRPASLEGALREQLGLQLEKVRADVEVLVIEQISMPSPN